MFEKDAKLRLHDIADARIEIDDELRPNPQIRRWSQAGDSSSERGAGPRGSAIVIAWAVSRLSTSETSGSVLRLQINPPTGGQFGEAKSVLRPSCAVS